MLWFSVGILGRLLVLRLGFTMGLWMHCVFGWLRGFSSYVGLKLLFALWLWVC